MAEKVLLKNFENFEGLNYKKSPLTSSLSQALQLTNYQFGEAYSIKGRRGCQVIGQCGDFVGIHNYTYYNSATGATSQELLALNDTLWRLASSTFTITRTGGSTTWDTKLLLNSATSSFRFTLTQGGSAITLVHPITSSSNAYLDVGTGLEADDNPSSLGVDTVLDLVQAIDAHANFSATMPIKTARVNGAQVGVRTINVDSGHTIAVGDIVMFYDWSETKLVARKITAITGTSITFSTDYQVVQVLDNQVIGPGASPAAGIPIFPATTATDPTQIITYYYWQPIQVGLAGNHLLVNANLEQTPLRSFWENRLDSNFINPCFLNAGNSCYIFGTAYNAIDARSYDSHIFKYDGTSVYRAGVPAPVTPVAFNSYASGSLTGSYKYIYTYEVKDAKGQIYESAPSPVSATFTPSAQSIGIIVYAMQVGIAKAVVNGAQTNTTSITIDANHQFKNKDECYFLNRRTTPNERVIRKITVASASSLSIEGISVDVNDNDIIYSTNTAYNYKYARVNGNQTNASTLTVHAAAGGVVPKDHEFEVGDYIYMRAESPTTANVVYFEAILTAVTSTTLAWSSSTYGTIDVIDGTFISAGLKINIYRTKAGGNIFYYLHSYANGDFTLVAHLDNAADSTLGYEFIEPPIGSKHDIPPKAGFGILREGILVVAGDPNNPNTVSFSSPEGLEYFPLSTNNFDIPSNIEGAISALGDDAINKLAVFKNNCYYDVDGDLTQGNFTVKAIREGDFGVSSHVSLVKVNGVLIGVGSFGFIATQNGEILLDADGDSIFSVINTAIQGNPNLRLHQAIAVNDRTTQHYTCYIPSTEGFGQQAGNANALMFSSCYTNKWLWFDKSYSAAIAPAGGFAVYNSVLYHLSKNWGSPQVADRAGHVFREIHEISGNPEQSYADNHLAITNTWLTQVETLGEPSIDKDFLRYKIFSLRSSFEVGTAFATAIKTYRNFQTSTYDTSSSLSFNGTTDFEKSLKLKANKARGLSIKHTSSTIHQCPFITGVELVIAIPYRREDIKR